MTFKVQYHFYFQHNSISNFFAVAESVSQPVHIDNNSNDNQPGREATETGDEGEVSDGTVDIKMVSRAMNRSEVHKFSILIYILLKETLVAPHF